MRKLNLVFVDRAPRPGEAIEEIISFAGKARRHGIVSLEQDADNVPDPFLRKALNLAVDGTDLDDIRRMMELEVAAEEHRGEDEAKVFEAAGGYAPTVGIIGAVLGLIQVMKHLENIDEVGRGIAVAFVATVYGVGSANLFFLPAANKLRSRVQRATQIRELMLEGVISIVEGLNPKLIRTKLEAYAREADPQPPPARPAVREERMSRRVQPGHANHERWLVSYADFITLMFAFFVVMFASSQADRSKAKRISESVTRALEDGPGAKRKFTVLEIQVGPEAGQGKEKSGGGASIYQAGDRLPAATSAQAAELLPSLQYLDAQLKNEIASGKMRISLEAADWW